MTLRSHGHRSTHVAALALATTTALAAACHKDTVVTSRPVIAWVPAACPIGSDGSATYLALGDFDGSQLPPVHPLSAVGTNLPEIDGEAREVVINATESSSITPWEGLAPVPDSGDVNVLILPHLTPCPLTNGVGARAASTLAAIGANRVMIVGGTGGSAGVPATYVADLTTGLVAPVTHDVNTARVGATVTAFGDGALLAGGVSVADGTAQKTAEVYSASLGGFDPSRTVTLDVPRAHHAAVVLADGRTLLIGGSSDAAGKNLLSTLYAITPGQNTGTEIGITTLAYPRLDPIAVRLASGEILVAGGKDASGTPVTHMEWISYEAGTNEQQSPQPWGGAPFTMTPLEGGGALVVETQFDTTWVVGEIGDVAEAPQAVLPTLSNAVLFGGAGGAPVLWTGDRFLRWSPWTATWGEFVTLDGAMVSVAGGIVSPDPGLGTWFDGAQQLVALRFDTHNAYSALQVSSTMDLMNDVSPDELSPSKFVSFSPDTGITVTSPAAAFVTDRTYEDVTVHVTSEAKPGACVVLRAAGPQPLILPDDGSTPGTTLDVQRTGATVSFSINGGPYKTSGTAIAVGTRVAVGVTGFPGTSPATVTGIRITRPGTP